MTFFVTGSALSRFKVRAKSRRGVLAQAKGGRRDAGQVLANGGAAALALALPGRRGQALFLGALATAAADTWATELGLLARRRPRLITSGHPVAPGTSGGVTPEGTLASLAGALTTGAALRRNGLAAAVACSARRPATPPAGPSAGPSSWPAVAGTAGAGVDSLLGATVQGVYWCPTCAEPAETAVHARCGRPAGLVRGRRWIDNDVVNVLATATGALTGAALSRSGTAFGESACQ